jgi:quercetin dioxygenase-like cupin family protein
MKNNEIEKSKEFITVEIIEYVANSVLIKTILKKSTGNISVMSFDSGEGLTEKSSPFDTFVQVIDGTSEIFINNKSHLLHTGQSIVIPANTVSYIKPNGRFKLIMSVIKSGYDI